MGPVRTWDRAYGSRAYGTCAPGTGVEEGPAQGQQHRQHHGGGQPAAVVEVFGAHRGRQGVLTQAPLPHVDADADRGADDGIDEQHHQQWVEQREPLQGRKWLGCQGRWQKRGHGSTAGQPWRMSNREK